MRGRKPKPTHLKLVAGNAGKRPLNKAEPKHALSIPSPPAELSDDAKVEWGRVAERLYRAGTLTEVDRSALAAYCQAYGRWIQAERTLAKLAEADKATGGLLIKTSNGNAIQNPLVGIANKAASDMVRYAAEFGMTPSARSRIKAEGQAPGDEADQFFG
jgi:P27 family predicted phage terminase small subunit